MNKVLFFGFLFFLSINLFAQITWMGNEYTTLASTQYLGDNILFEIQSYPQGENQGAQVYIDWNNDGYGSTLNVDYFNLTYQGSVGNNSKWNAYVKMRATGTHNRQYLGWQTGQSDYNTGDLGTFTVSALENPSGNSALSSSSSSISLSWTKWNSKNVMILRKLSSASWTEPNQGTAYSVGNTIGDATVVYNGSGTSFTDSDLLPNTSYDYRFYSENYSYYSGGAISANISTNNTSTTDYFRSKSTGDWNTAGTWESSPNNSNWATSTLVPGENATSITILAGHNITLNADNVTVSSLTINSGATFTASDETSRTLTIAAGGSLTNNGTFTAGTGTVSFAGSGTVSGTVGFNNVSIAGGVNFGASSTVSGVLQINAGGYVITNAPTYLTGSILRYNTGTDYDISGEWYADQTTGAGIPYNVDINSSTQVHFSGSQKHTMNGSFTIASGKTFSLSSEYGADFYIKGDFINNGGTFNSNSRLVTFNGTANQEFKGAGSTSFGYVTIDNSAGVVLNGSGLITVGNDLTINFGKKLTINPGKSLTVSGTLTNNAGSSGLVIKSDATSTGSLITNGTVTGNITAQRYIPGYSKGATGFHLLSSPVSGQLISPGFVNVESIPAATDFYYFNEEHNYWINIKNNLGNYNQGATWENFSNEANPSFIVGKGYLVGYSTAPDPTLEFTGEPNTGNLASGSGIPALTYTEGLGKGWNLVGNPYPSAIDWDHAEWVKTNINGSVYVYEGSSGNYISWNGTTGGLTDGIIPAMQGFFVKADAASPALTIPNNARVASSSNLYKSSYDAVADNVLVVSCESQGLSDQLYLHFDDEATVNYDSRFDAYKLMGTGNSPQIYSSSDDKLLSISALPLSFDEMAIPVHVKVIVPGLHTLSLPINTLVASQQVYLEDTKENTVVKLTATDSYSFIGETTDSPSRFKLTFSGVGLDSPVTTDPQTIFTYGNQLFIQNPGTALVEIYTFAGQLVARQNVNESGLWSQPLHLSAGQYVVRVVNGSFAKTAKVVLF